MSQSGEWLRAARASLAAARTRGELPRTTPPPWLKEPDALVHAFAEQERLLREGRVVWAMTVVSNDLLAQGGWMDAPAFVIHGMEDALDDEPERLDGPAQALFELSGDGAGTEEERAFGSRLADKFDRATWRIVPATLGRNLKLHLSAVLIVRRWLPNRRLSTLPLPLLVHPSRSGHVLPLPLEFWPEAMRAAWIADTSASEDEQVAEAEELRVGGVGFLFPVALIGSVVSVPALADRVGLWVGEAPEAAHRWFFALTLPALLLGLVGWVRRKWRKAPAERVVYDAFDGHEIKLLSNDELGLSLAQWAGILALFATLLKYVPLD